MFDWPTKRMLESMSYVAPGTPLRDGLDRILQARTGGLIVMGAGHPVEQVCAGGFVIESQLSPQRLSELSKMDGAIILDDIGEFILRANVHLVPDADTPTTETGTRHRTAEQVARITNATVISVSQRMSTISLYVGDDKRVLEPVASVLSRANQAAATLERYRSRFDSVSSSLSALEVEDLVTARDVLQVLQRGEMVRRIAEETEVLLAELGTEGRLLQLQMDELAASVDQEISLVIRDYAERESQTPDESIDKLARIPTEGLGDLSAVARVLGVSAAAIDLSVSPRGYRFLSRIPRVAPGVVERIVHRYDSLQKILNATVAELEEIEAIGEVRALQIKEGLARLAESSILERYS